MIWLSLFDTSGVAFSPGPFQSSSSRSVANDSRYPSNCNCLRKKNQFDKACEYGTALIPQLYRAKVTISKHHLSMKASNICL